MLGVNSGEHIMFSTDVLNNLTLLDKYSQVRLSSPKIHKCTELESKSRNEHFFRTGRLSALGLSGQSLIQASLTLKQWVRKASTITHVYFLIDLAKYVTLSDPRVSQTFGYEKHGLNVCLFCLMLSRLLLIEQIKRKTTANQNCLQSIAGRLWGSTSTIL